MRETAVDDSEAHWSREHSALARSFGYFEDSNSNTMALLRRVSLLVSLSLRYHLDLFNRTAGIA